MSRPDKNIPKGYFENLPHKMNDLISDLKDDIQDSAPLLHRISQLESYKVPSEYFLQFSKTLNLKQGRTVSLVQKLRPFLAAASILALVAVLWTFSINQQNGDNDLLVMNDVYDYYLDNIDELDQSMILEISEEEISNEEVLFDDLTVTELELFEDVIISNLTDQELLDIL